MLTSTAQGQREGNLVALKTQANLNPRTLAVCRCQPILARFISSRIGFLRSWPITLHYAVRNAVNDSEDHLVHYSVG